MTEAKHKIIEQLVSDEFITKSECTPDEVQKLSDLDKSGEELPYNIYKKTDRKKNTTYIKYDYREEELSELLLLANTKSLSIIQFFNVVFFLTFAFCVILLMLLFFEEVVYETYNFCSC